MEGCATDLYRHPQLDMDIDSVKAIYADTAVSVREHGSIDDVDVDMLINVSFLDDEVARAWKIVPTEPIIVRLRFSLSQYLNGPAPSVEVFQPSNREGFSLGLQLQNSNQPSSVSTLFSSCFGFYPSHVTSRPVFSPQRVAVSAVKSPAHITTKQLVELLFSSQAFIQCKSAPTLQHGFLVQVMKYAEQRIPTLNEYCVVCDERHTFQYASMLKPAVCSRELCVLSFYALGVMAGAAEEVSNGAEVVDLLVAMCRAALESSRKSIIFEPYPSVVDPFNPKSLAFSPKKKSYDRLQKALDSIMTIREMTQGPYSSIKKQMDTIDPLAHPLLQRITSSNRSHIVKLPLNRQLKFMHTPHQFLLTSSPPAEEARFRVARKVYGSTSAFHGSHIENWHSILRNGLVNASSTKLQLHGAAYGRGIYLSPVSSVSYGYSGMGKGQHHVTTKQELSKRYNRINTVQQERQGQSRFLQSRNLNCIALCEVITSKDLQKHGDTWVCPISDHVCTRFFFVYENGQVGDADINTQDIRIEQEIIRAIETKPI
uniref:protein mono-ADP-ribosyltransferase PARP6-like n=1 Tax=Oncorhynchus gorbuscha TaxID=8017 RepID=UPI001EAF423F|nr:protein mono-ADP-ribosyltransferase PARP6-like [Oncorhynchus gorbuscha]